MATATTRRRTVFEDVLDRLVEFRATGAPVLSVYFDVSADPDALKSFHARVYLLLKPMYELATSSELTHAARESVRADIAKIEGLAERGRSDLLGRSVAVFACSLAGLYEEVALATHVRDRAIADETPYLRPLLAAVSRARCYLVVIVERGASWFYELFMQHLDEADEIIEPSTRRPGRPSEHDSDRRHVQNRTSTLARKHYHATADAAEALMQKSGAELLVIGGHQETVSEFAESLPKELQPRVVGTFVIDPKTMTPAQVREHVQPIVDEYERAESARLVATAYERAALGGNGAIGLEWCLLATVERAVDALLIHDDSEAAGRVCDNCGWLGLAGEECPVCGRPTRPTPDVIDDMVEAVLVADGRIEHVESETPLSVDVVGALLRFPVPKPM
jgi:peptide chain release factor subunit 1